jgi:hypothetical protein
MERFLLLYLYYLLGKILKEYLGDRKSFNKIRLKLNGTLAFPMLFEQKGSGPHK